MLTSYIKTNQMKKTISILKILLNHYVRKSMNRENSASSLSSYRNSKYSSTSKSKLAWKISESYQNRENFEKNAK